MNPLGQLQISSEVLRLIAELDEFKGRWQALGQLAPERLSVLRRVATIESVGSSTRIEGARLSDIEVERLLAGAKTYSFRSRDEEEVAGYADAMELVFESFAEISLTENHIKQLHGTLLRHAQKDASHRGQYKTVPNQVEAVDADGKSLGVIFVTAPPLDTPRLMAELVGWTRRSLQAREHHPLLVIAAFLVRFLAIHPFQDGNGRLSRVLTTLLLLRAGYTHVPYASLERVIEDNKDGYYLALRRSQATLDGDESKLSEWMLYFLRALVAQKNALARKIERERLIAPLPPLSEKLLAIAREHGRVTTSTGATLTGANRNTIKAHLRRLVASGHLVQQGQGKGTWYSPGT
ncbi:MAG TPA: Fic family protein [Polyangia bacterium]|jgi:Fic family protein